MSFVTYGSFPVGNELLSGTAGNIRRLPAGGGWINQFLSGTIGKPPDTFPYRANERMIGTHDTLNASNPSFPCVLPRPPRYRVRWVPLLARGLLMLLIRFKVGVS